MFERYNEAARRVVFFGRYEANIRDANAIRPEHLLLGLLREETSRPSMAWPPGPRSAGDVRADLEQTLPAPAAADPKRDIPLTLESKRALIKATEYSVRLRQNYIGVGHLLLGLLTHETDMWRWLRKRFSVAAYLRRAGFEVRALEQHVSDLPAHGEDPRRQARANPTDASP
jgi:ATP-dependent Clp protease ATP-binding subunit ClpA